MDIDHRRPLVAFISVAVLCAVVMVQTTLYVIRSPLGGGLDVAARGLVSTLGGAAAPSLIPELVTGDTVLALPGATAGITRTAEPPVSPVLGLPEIAPVLGSGAPLGGAASPAAAPGAVGDAPGQAASDGPSQGDGGTGGNGNDGGAGNNGDGNGNGRGDGDGDGDGTDGRPPVAEGTLELLRLTEAYEQGVDLQALVTVAEEELELEPAEVAQLTMAAQLIESSADLEVPIAPEMLLELVDLDQLVVLDEQLAAQLEPPGEGDGPVLEEPDDETGPVEPTDETEQDQPNESEPRQADRDPQRQDDDARDDVAPQPKQPEQQSDPVEPVAEPAPAAPAPAAPAPAAPAEPAAPTPAPSAPAEPTPAPVEAPAPAPAEQPAPQAPVEAPEAQAPAPARADDAAPAGG